MSFQSIINNLSINSSDNIIKIEDNNYRFDVSLASTDGKLVKLKFAAIVDFKIVDSLDIPWTEGYLIFENIDDVVESGEFIGRSDDGTPKKAFVPYTFRGDGRDLLVVNICPQLGEDDDLDAIPGESSPRGMVYTYSIYNTEDITAENDSIKLKKLYFRDYACGILLEKNSFFSTGSFRPGTSNTDRSLLTGQVIQLIIDRTFYEDYGIPQKFSQDWDFGSSTIFYSSNPSYKAMDDIRYLLDYHVSSEQTDNSPCILRKERNDIWTLIPISSYFKQGYYAGNSSFGDLGGSRLTETFILPNETTDDTYNEQPSRNPSVSLFADELADYNTIHSFQFSNMTSTDTSESMVTHFVHNYDPAQKTFSVDLAQNNIYRNDEIYRQNFVGGFKGIQAPAKSNLTYNQIRALHKDVRHHFNPNTNNFQRLNSGRNRALLASIFLNNTISFRVRGNTARTAGKFITISRNDSSIDNSFDNKIMGTYLIVKVEHCFGQGRYYNNMICTKTYNTDQNNTFNGVL